MDQDANKNLHSGDVPVGDAAVNAHSAAPVNAEVLNRDTSEVSDLPVADAVAEQIEQDQPIHVPLGT